MESEECMAWKVEEQEKMVTQTMHYQDLIKVTKCILESIDYCENLRKKMNMFVILQGIINISLVITVLLCK